ncbi:MAG: acetyl-CoA carboxylase, biotin carboxyl carrier protein [Bdellovibrionales bacterium GWA2_49_15]|nr:MAG: acetyl-CoA carboxylase, biotin carboxyl carrier protein [Bdellovibrionales bacterium GWA2_49_15]
MDIKKIEEFIQLAKKNEVTKLTYENDGMRVSVSFEQKVISESISSSASRDQIHSAPTHGKTAEPKLLRPDLIEIKCPFVGTFYRTPSPGSDPYVKVGDTIRPGQVLCIVEAMKIMNEIESEVSGTIEEICIENETYVEFGQVLYRVKVK